MYHNVSSHRGVIVNPGGIIRIHIYTSMDHWCAKVIMPVSSMDRVSFVKEHRKRHTFQVITGACHCNGRIFGKDLKGAGDRFITARTGGDLKPVNELVVSV